MKKPTTRDPVPATRDPKPTTRTYRRARAVFFEPKRCPVCGQTSFRTVKTCSDGGSYAHCLACASLGRVTIVRFIPKK